MAEVVVIGGPNGAGKTSWALKYLEPTLGIREFINADEIARGLSPLNPEGAAFPASRLMLDRIRLLANARVDFAFETTCAGRGHVRLLERLRMDGYRLMLVFLWLPSPDTALARVARRVADGGHGIPKAVVIRRYVAGLSNMRNIYLPLVDHGLVYDNSDGSGTLIAERPLDKTIVVHDSARWSLIEEMTR